MYRKIHMRLSINSNFKDRIQFGEYIFGFHISNIILWIDTKNFEDFGIDLRDNHIWTKFQSFIFVAETKFGNGNIFSDCNATENFWGFYFDVKLS